MKQKRFSDEQIIGILKEADAGAVVLDLCRRHGVSSATFYTWKAKYGGLDRAQTQIETARGWRSRTVAGDRAAERALVARFRA